MIKLIHLICLSIIFCSISYADAAKNFVINYDYIILLESGIKKETKKIGFKNIQMIKGESCVLVDDGILRQERFLSRSNVRYIFGIKKGDGIPMYFFSLLDSKNKFHLDKENKIDLNEIILKLPKKIEQNPD